MSAPECLCPSYCPAGSMFSSGPTLHPVQNMGMIKGPFSLSRLPQGITCVSGPQAWPLHLTIIYSRHTHSTVNSVLLCSYPHELDVSDSV